VRGGPGVGAMGRGRAAVVVMVHESVRGRDGGAGRSGVVELGVDARGRRVAVLPWWRWWGEGGCVGDVACVCRAVRRVCVAAALSLQCRRGMAVRVREVDRQLCDAADRGDVAGISLALLAGAGVNIFEGTGGWTPLQWAARRGHVSAMEALLAAGAHVDSVDSSGWTPLMHAANNGRAAALAVLLAAGVDVHRFDCFGDTALHRACCFGRVDCARTLLDAGARMDVRNRHGERPIDAVSAEL